MLLIIWLGLEHYDVEFSNVAKIQVIQFAIYQQSTGDHFGYEIV